MITTERLVLRPWEDRDRAVFLEQWRDPRVMQFLGPPMSEDEADAAIARQRDCQEQHGHSFWAVERRSDEALLGFCGLKPGGEGTPLYGEIEIGWRLGVEYWGRGYAREAAMASLDWGWRNLAVPRIGAITVEANAPSWGLMKRLGMQRVPGTFKHPAVPDGSPLKTCITYFVDRPETAPETAAV
ncbi:GNAT family N-acetyltransferase [Stakelama marina]|uniref:GNAT family N-acetyltransferase n=1 Tax=Stakelama marina TaxID=2826939 RepID=A0A8T4IFK1_9SPHN|nr:GNAT family N-acetyltransferase [Stakelama marina]MBR0551835.1 GNAT family N-acetyltransferase [Stakelama marina]